MKARGQPGTMDVMAVCVETRWSSGLTCRARHILEGPAFRADVVEVQHSHMMLVSDVGDLQVLVDDAGAFTVLLAHDVRALKLRVGDHERVSLVQLAPNPSGMRLPDRPHGRKFFAVRRADEPGKLRGPFVQVVPDPVDLSMHRFADAALAAGDGLLDAVPDAREDVARITVHEPDEDVAVQGVGKSAPPAR